MSTGNEWLSSLQVGDEVILDGGGWLSGQRVTHVIGFTKTGVRIQALPRCLFRRTDGHLKTTDHWSTAMLRQATPDAVAKLQTEQVRARLLRRLESTSWRTYSTDTLEAVARLLAPTNESESEG